MVLFFGIIFLRLVLVQATPSINVIVARYKEPLEHLRWLHHFPHIIYNRDHLSVPDMNDLNTIYQPINVGREGWIYADHIINHYNNLSDINIFTQTIQSCITDTQFRKYTEDLASGAMSLDSTRGFAYMGDQCLTVRSGMGSVSDVRDKYNISASAYERSQEGMREIISQILLKTNLPLQAERLRFNPTAVFAVSKEAILSNPVSYYLRLRDKVLGDGDKTQFKDEGDRILQFLYVYTLML
jgi:hypothetical protein